MMAFDPTQPAAVLHTQHLPTPLGTMLACASAGGLCMLEFVDTPALQRKCDALQRLLGARMQPGPHPHLALTAQQLQEYFQEQRRDFSVPLDMPGTAFQQRVWRGLCGITFGQTQSYQAFAQTLGVPRAVRAVALANGANRISILVPCHRVIGKNGRLTGYGGGLPRKQWLLAHEGSWPSPVPAASVPASAPGPQSCLFAR